MLRRVLRFLPLETIHGYEHPELIEAIFHKTEAYTPTAPWPEIAGARAVLDFGGGCGRHYKEAANQSPGLRWAVVETPSMVTRARELQTQNLHFFTSIEEAAEWLGEVDLVHSNGALQYAPDPIGTVNQLCQLNAKRLLWYRLVFGSGERQKQISFLSDNGPGQSKGISKKVAYERTLIPLAVFLDAHRGYTLTDRGLDHFHFSR